MKKVRLGIIGLGYMGKLHLKHAQKLPNVDYVAVADSSKRALRLAKNSGAKKTFTDFEQLLNDQEIDAVIIALPTHLHSKCALKAAEAGKDIFLEKPMARNPDEAKGIINAAKKNSVKLMMGYHLRFNKTFRKLKTQIDDGSLGDIELASGTFVGSGPFFHRAETHTPLPVPDWWFNKELTGGGALIDVGSHIINLLRWYFGEITHIRSHLGYRFNLDFEDTAMCFAKFDSGTAAVINAGWFSHNFKLKVDCYGTVDHAVVEHRPGSKVIAAAQMVTTGLSDFHRAHFDELEYFVKCLIQDLVPSSSGEDGLKDLEAIYQAYQNSII